MADDIAATTTAGEDERRLHELGYAQELMRRMSGFSNFAVSFTIISILSGCLTLYYFGMDEGGPAIIVWGWPIVGIMTLMVGLAMAEVCSSFPTAGGLYYWAAKLAPRNGPAWSWFTGWFNFLGQVAVTAGIDFGAAVFINFLFSLWFNFDTATRWHTIVIYAAVLLLHGLLNQFGIRLVALLNDISVWWHITGVLIIVGALIFGLKAGAHHASAGFVFSHLENLSGFHIGWWYILPVGLLMAQYTFTGYDASAHMTEETHDAARSGPRGIVMSILISLIAGWVLLIGVTFAIQKGNYVNEALAGTAAPGQIFIDSIGRTGAELLADDLRVLPGRRAARLGLLAQGEQADQDADQRDLAGCRRRADPRPAVPVEHRRLRRGDLDRGHRPVHRVRDADVPAAAAGRQLQARPVAPGPVELRDRLDGRDLGRDHRPPVHAAAVRPHRLGHIQLRMYRGRRGDRVRRHLLAGLGEELVQGPEGPGFV